MKRPPTWCPWLVLLGLIMLSACGQVVYGITPDEVTSTATSQINSTPPASPTPTLKEPPSATPIPDWYQILPASSSGLEYRYALVNDAEAKVYNSLQDALRDSSNFTHLPSIPAYIAYTSVEVRDERTYYVLRYGKTMRGEDLHEISYSTFSGVLITENVHFRFGWVLSDTQSRDTTGTPVRTFVRYQLVQEFPAQRAGFFAVGADEWLPEEYLALVDPALPAEAGRYNCRFIYVDLAEQTLSAYDDCRLIYTTLVSSGQDVYRTKPIESAVLYKMEYLTTSSEDDAVSPYYLENVPYFMTYFGNLGIHGAYWHDQFGSPVSHGCINLSPADAAWLYGWAVLGERVFISAGR